MKVAFDNVIRGVLVLSMERMSCSLGSRNWMFRFVGTCKASLVVDEKRSGSKQIEINITQSSSISFLWFLIFISDV